ncbi:MAG: NAD(P)-dependent oxidoreductase [Solirubrobacteraceae bacterium]
MRVAFLGLGIMGSRMAANVARADFDLTVWNRTESRAEAFCAEHSARLAATPGHAAADADVVITMVVDGPQVHEVLLGREGAATTAAEGTLFIDCSTIGPAATHEVAAGLARHGCRLLDAPVTGSSPKAQDGTLTIMVGGDRDDFQRAKPVFEAMGSLIVYCGPSGQGQMVKLLNNAVAATNAAVLAQALVVGAKAGVDLDALVCVMGAGAGGSAMLDLKAGPMRAHDYTTLFKLEHMLKDVRLCLEEGQELGVPFPSAAQTHQLLTAAMGLGHGDDDFAAVVEAVENAAATRL